MKTLPAQMTRIEVAFQGARGAFSEQACRQLLAGHELDFHPLGRFVDVYEELLAGKVGYAVIPFENTLHGSVHENYDYLLQYKPAILAETRVRIVHNLIGKPEARFSEIERAISHPVALSQCMEFFRKNPRIRAESHYDTGGSVKTVMEGADETTAAIASAHAAKYYGAKILRKSIEDDRENYTRFFLLSAKRRRIGRADGQVEDLAGLCYEERFRRSVPLHERLRAARHQPDQDRVAAAEGPSVRVPVLRGHPGLAGRRELLQRAAPSRRDDGDAGGARLLPARGIAAGGPSA